MVSLRRVGVLVALVLLVALPAVLGAATFAAPKPSLNQTQDNIRTGYFGTTYTTANGDCSNGDGAQTTTANLAVGTYLFVFIWKPSNGDSLTLQFDSFSNRSATAYVGLVVNSDATLSLANAGAVAASSETFYAPYVDNLTAGTTRVQRVAFVATIDSTYHFFRGNAGVWQFATGVTDNATSPLTSVSCQGGSAIQIFTSVVPGSPGAPSITLGKPWFTTARIGTCAGPTSTLFKSNTTPSAPSPSGTRVNWDANGTGGMTTDFDQTTYGELDDTAPCGGGSCDSNHGGVATIGAPPGTSGFNFYNSWEDVNITFGTPGYYNVTSVNATLAYNFPSSSTAPGGLCVGVYGKQFATQTYVYLATWQVSTRNTKQSFNSSLGVGFNLDSLRLVPFQSCCGGFLFWEVYELDAQGAFVGTVSGAPTLTATPGNAQVALSWTSVASAARYNVYRGVGVACTSGTPMNSSSNCAYVGTTASLAYTDSPLTNGVTYHYRVAAVNDLPSEGPASNDASATPALTASVLTGFAASDCSATLNWTAIGGALTYLVNESDFTSSSKPFVNVANVSAPAVTATVTGLASGLTYRFKIFGYDGSFSAPSNELDLLMPRCTLSLVGGSGLIYGGGTGSGFGGSSVSQGRAAIAVGLGVPVGAVDVLISILLIMLCSGVIFAVTQSAMGAGIGAALGLFITIALGLLPLWAVVFFIAGVAAVGLLFMGSRSGNGGGA